MSDMIPRSHIPYLDVITQTALLGSEEAATAAAIAALAYVSYLYAEAMFAHSSSPLQGHYPAIVERQIQGLQAFIDALEQCRLLLQAQAPL